MSLRDKLRQGSQASQHALKTTFGVLTNPFPTSNQTTENPHFRIDADDEAEARILAFFREGRSEVLVVLGTQGVGKTNFLNYFESQILEVTDDHDDYYIVRYMADPEPSFDGTIRVILQELGIPHLKKIAKSLPDSPESLSVVRSFDLRLALLALSKNPDDDDLFTLCSEWLLGARLLKAHRHGLDVNFRLDTVESRTAALRDYILLSSKLGVLKGIFLLLDELEKQAGVLSPTAVVRYLSGLRAIIDALPKHLFMIMAVTPDAMRRYSSALPAFRSRLENRISLLPLASFQEARNLAKFYLTKARNEASKIDGNQLGESELVTEGEMSEVFAAAVKESERRGDEGVRQRGFLNTLHNIAEAKIQNLD